MSLNGYIHTTQPHTQVHLRTVSNDLCNILVQEMSDVDTDILLVGYFRPVAGVILLMCCTLLTDVLNSTYRCVVLYLQMCCSLLTDVLYSTY